MSEGAGPCFPDFKPIEYAFAKLNGHLRKGVERTVDGLWSAIGRIVDLFAPAECDSACKIGSDAVLVVTKLSDYTAPMTRA